jgi:hypothetical protein
MHESSLSGLERELLELCSMAAYSGQTTTSLDEELLKSSPGRSAVDATLRGLVARGLVTTEREIFMGARTYEDDWWIVTNVGRAAIGLPSILRPTQARLSRRNRFLRRCVMRFFRWYVRKRHI